LFVWLTFINQNKILIFENNIFEPQIALYLGFATAIFWIILYAFSGYYYDIYRKSRVQELYHTFITSLIGVGIILFILFSKQNITQFTTFSGLLINYFILHFITTYILRLILTTVTINRIRNKKIRDLIPLLSEVTEKQNVFIMNLHNGKNRQVIK